jgi:hypothetical protein
MPDISYFWCGFYSMMDPRFLEVLKLIGHVSKLLQAADFIPKFPPSRIALIDLGGTLIAWNCQSLCRSFYPPPRAVAGIFLPKHGSLLNG